MKLDLSAIMVATFTLVFGVAAGAQLPTGKVARLHFLENERKATSERREAFFQALSEHGWVEGQNIIIDRRYWENRAERLPTLANEMVRLKPDIIVTTTGMAALAVKRATTTIPIVMTASADAVNQRLVASLAHPGGNVTGMTNISSDLTGKQLELLQEAFPKVSRVAVLECAASGNVLGRTRRREMKATEGVLKLRLQFLKINDPNQIESALRSAIRERADALFVSDCTNFPAAETVDLIAKTKLPAIYPATRFAEAGGLVMYGASDADLWRRAATYVDKILKGQKPADLPVQQPMKFDLVINLKTAKQIGVTIPPEVLARANRVIR
jgi:ABC-type uncharacterized transport system substrate-binding protein